MRINESLSCPRKYFSYGACPVRGAGCDAGRADAGSCQGPRASADADKGYVYTTTFHGLARMHSIHLGSVFHSQRRRDAPWYLLLPASALLPRQRWICQRTLQIPRQSLNWPDGLSWQNSLSFLKACQTGCLVGFPLLAEVWASSPSVTENPHKAAGRISHAVNDGACFSVQGMGQLSMDSTSRGSR